MNKDNRSSTASGIRSYLENLPVLGRPILLLFNLVGSIISIIRKLSSFFNSLGGFIYIMTICVGTIALLVSAMIEYVIMVAAYNSEMAISSIPYEILKFVWSLLFGKQPDNIDLSDNMPRSFLFPLLNVTCFEGAKCIFTLYYYADRRRDRFWRQLIFGGVLRFLLIIFSLLCSVMFFAELMNKPKEDEINEEIKIATEKLNNEINQKITDKINIDIDINRLEGEIEELDKENKSAREKLEAEAQRVTYGLKARGIQQTIDNRYKRIDELKENISKIKSKIEADVKFEADEEIKEVDENIRKGGIALDPKWMSSTLSLVHEAFYPESRGVYSRKSAIFFIAFFCITVSLALELIINEMFKRVAMKTPETHNDL